MLALDPRLATSFTTGLVAAINPCGFVLLPAYLLYFLGMEPSGRESERASVRRALLVGLAVSAGFLVVFIVVGVAARNSLTVLSDRAPWVALVIGAALVVLGIAMVFGYRLPFTTPKLAIGERDRTVRSMFVFGCAYAVASIGCALPLFSSTVLGGISDGFPTAVAAIGMYSLGMALVVIGLTVTLALAKRRLLGVLRGGMRWFEPVTGVVVLLTGAYLMWYWYHGIRKDDYGPAIGRAIGWQERLSDWVQRNQSAVVTASIVMIVAAVAVAVFRRETPSSEA